MKNNLTNFFLKNKFIFIINNLIKKDEKKGINVSKKTTATKRNKEKYFF
jgi:hypothetical protein